MKFSRSLRWHSAVIALACMLFMQLAVAAYACPQLAAGPAGGHEDAMATAHAGAAPCCAKPDPAQPALCHAHGQAGKQSLDKHELPPLPPFSAAGLAIPLAIAGTTGARAMTPAATPSLARATAPPLSIRHCCFRI